MTLSFMDLLTVTGALAAVLIITQVIKQVVPNFNSDRFGALTAIAVGIAVVCAANAVALAEVALGWGEAVWTGFIAGASASGIYQAGKATITGSSAPDKQE